MRLLAVWTQRLCRTLCAGRVTGTMSTPAVSNGVKRGPSDSEPDGSAELKKPRAEGNGGEQAADGGAADGGQLKPADGGAADGGQGKPAVGTPAVDSGAVPPAERWKLKKVLLLVSYSGKGYLGMQRNPGCRTIEEELLQALHRARAIPDHGLREQQSVWFQRAARTDKGVSAAKQCVSLKMAADTDGVLEAINAQLPAQIRVFDMKRVTKRFDAKLQCCARTYHYMSPTFAFTPLEGVVSEEFRISEEVLKDVNRLFGRYQGTHNYHNFTSRRKPTDPSNKRFIMSMGCGQPFVRQGIEFVVITVKGQSFMLHQIRKMVGTVMAVTRGHAAESVFERAWSLDRIDLPVAPALGLLLHEVHYERYNKRFGSGGHNTHENIDWAAVEDKVAAFTERFIYADMVQTELQDKSMLTWLETLPLHTFDIREGDKSPLLAAKLLADAEAGTGSQPDPEDGTAEVSTTEVRSAEGDTADGRSAEDGGTAEVRPAADGSESGTPDGAGQADQSAVSGGTPAADVQSAASAADATDPADDKPADSGGTPAADVQSAASAADATDPADDKPADSGAVEGDDKPVSDCGKVEASS